MELREWQYINKPASNSSGSNKSFKKRFDKIIKYYGDHLPAEVDFVYVNLLTPGSLNFTENYDNGDKVQYDIFIDDFDTEDWGIKIKVNGQPTEKYFDKGWSKLLNTLGAYIELPQAGDPEYTNLLTEWVEMKNNNSPSGSYKKRFEKLIKYHIDHASSELESITKKDIKDDGFRLSEHYNDGSEEFDRDIVVSYDKDSDTFMLRIFVDGKTVNNILCNGYEDFVTAAEGYMFLPDYNTPEYDDLLTESLNEWKLMNPPKAAQPASSSPKNYPSQEDRYRRLLAQIDSDGVCKYTVSLLDDRVLTFTTHDGLPIKIIFKPYVNPPSYLVQIDGKDFYDNSYEDVLNLLLDIEVIKNTDLCESFSIADDFKAYENLWN